MSLSRFSGPVYGSKSLIASATIATTSSGASSALACSWVVPVYEDWFICEIAGFCSTCSSGGNTLTIKSEGGSTTAAGRDWAGGSNSTKAQTIGSVTWGTSTTGPTLSAALTPTAGEYEGVWVPAGSTIRAVLSSVVNPIASLNINLRGYTRFVNSTRSEG
jgi:hypothetical protein